MSETSIRVLIADDHPIVRQGLQTLLCAQDNIELVGEAQDGEEAVLLAAATQPDIILLDLVMPQLDGIAALPLIGKACANARVLVLTSVIDDDMLLAAIESGAAGCVIKDSATGELLAAIRAVARGETVIPPQVAQRLLARIGVSAHSDPFGEVTEREREVLRLVAHGMSNAAIAGVLGISVRTVHVHMRNLLEKLDCDNRVQLALYARERGHF
jgi:DNA-binding NarL/FixJ family response regulator